VAGPGSTLTINAKPNVDYWVYADANASCSADIEDLFSSDFGGDAETEVGGPVGHRFVLLDDPPGEVTQGGQTYTYLGHFFADVDGGGTFKVACGGGFGLVEAASPSWISYPAIGLMILVALTLVAEANIAIWRHRSRSY
jgi:hypothetical protein